MCLLVVDPELDGACKTGYVIALSSVSDSTQFNSIYNYRDDIIKQYDWAEAVLKNVFTTHKYTAYLAGFHVWNKRDDAIRYGLHCWKWYRTNKKYGHYFLSLIRVQGLNPIVTGTQIRDKTDSRLWKVLRRAESEEYRDQYIDYPKDAGGHVTLFEFRRITDCIGIIDNGALIDYDTKKQAVELDRLKFMSNPVVADKMTKTFARSFDSKMVNDLAKTLAFVKSTP